LPLNWVLFSLFKLLVMTKKPLDIVLLQQPLIWEDPAANRIFFENLFTQHSLQGRLVVMPEMFTTGFSTKPQNLAEKMDGKTVQWMKQQAAQHRMILCGSLIVEEDQHFFNRFVCAFPNGKIASYDKRHLFSFAGEDEFFSPGQNRVILSINGWKILLLVCYDLRFPVWSRNKWLPVQHESPSAEFDMILYTANWPKARIDAWKTLLKARAIENQCFVAGVNRVGIDGNGVEYNGMSMIFDPLGNPLTEEKDEDCFLGYTLNPSKLSEIQSKFPFLKDGDVFQIQP